jgi:hypothetical protein
MSKQPRTDAQSRSSPGSPAVAHRARFVLACAATAAAALAPAAVTARADTAHDPHVAIEDPRLLPFVPVLAQCLERRGQYATTTDFFRTEYGVACAAVLLSFRLVTNEELAEAWAR